MKSNIIKSLCFVSLLATSLLFSACKKDNNQNGSIVGKWNLTMINEGDLSSTPEEQGATATYEYREDGTYHAEFTLEFYGELLEQQEDGNYTIDGKQLHLSWVEDGEQMSQDNEIQELTETTLVIKERYEDGELGMIESIKTYERVK